MAEETEVSTAIEVTMDKPVRTKGVKAPTRGREMDRFLKQAVNGDENCLPKARALLSDPERGEITTRYCGSSAEWLRQTISKKASGGNVVVREAIQKKIDEIRAELEGPNPSPIERLLAERASLCWFAVNWYEERFINANEMSLTQADYFQRRIHRTHQRFLSAVETLARVRKLAVPALQVNIARNQVNLAGAGPTGGSPP
jgi:hypothetical protein